MNDEDGADGRRADDPRPDHRPADDAAPRCGSADGRSTGSAACPSSTGTAVLVGVISQTDLVRARATEHLWTAGRARGPPSHDLAGDHRDRRRVRRGGRRLMEEHRIHRLVVVAADGETPDRRPLGERPRPLDGRVERVMDELGLHELAAPVRKGAGEPKELHESRLGPASTVFDVHAYVDDFNARRRCLPARAPRTSSCRPSRRRPQHHPARHRRDARLQRPRAADPGVHLRRLRRLHGLRQRLPGHGDPRRRAAGIGHRRRDRRPSRRPARAAPSPRRAARATSPTPEVRRRPEPTRPRAGPFGIFVDPVHCKGCASASRSATRSATTRCG